VKFVTREMNFVTLCETKRQIASVYRVFRRLQPKIWNTILKVPGYNQTLDLLCCKLSRNQPAGFSFLHLKQSIAGWCLVIFNNSGLFLKFWFKISAKRFIFRSYGWLCQQLFNLSAKLP